MSRLKCAYFHVIILVSKRKYKKCMLSDFDPIITDMTVAHECRILATRGNLISFLYTNSYVQIHQDKYPDNKKGLIK
jgi:hypothetical protein